MKRCELTTLEKKRGKGELIEAYKIITGNESIQKKEGLFELAPSKGNSGHRYITHYLTKGKEH